MVCICACVCINTSGLVFVKWPPTEAPFVYMLLQNLWRPSWFHPPERDRESEEPAKSDVK